MADGEKESFLGVTLDLEQQKNLSNYVKSVLGDTCYAMADEFFREIWESFADYKVFLPRRCFNLMYTMYRTIYDSQKGNANFSDFNFYTDSALLANASQIAEEYLTWGFMPEILIVDDILIHGRTLSQLIINLIDSVYDAVEVIRPDADKSDVEEAILRSLTVRTMVRSNNPLLIPRKFRRCLEYKTDRSDVWSPVRWHELSSRLSIIAAEGFFCNTSFVLSLYENEDPDLHLKFAAAAEALGFEPCRWKNIYERDSWVKPLINSWGETVAVYTLRIVQSSFDKKYRIIPFVMMSDFSLSKFQKNSQYNKLEYFVTNYLGIDISKFHTKNHTEALYMLLSHNLLLLLEQQTGEHLVKAECLDVDKVILNFKNSTLDNLKYNIVKKAADLTEPLLSWKEMDKFIFDNTEESKPLFMPPCYTFKSVYENAKDALGEMIAKEGEAREKEAHHAYSGIIRNVFGTGRKTISGLLQKMNGFNIAETIGFLLFYMDKGVAAVNSRIENGRCACVYRAGEQSLFIHVRKYSADLPVLIAMEKDCVRNKDEIIKRIGRFYSDTPDHADELKEFVEMLYSTGQHLSDWDINFFKWTEISDDVRRRYKNKDENEMLNLQMFMESAQRFRIMEKYRSMYRQ